MDSKDIINAEKEIEQLSLFKSKNKLINLKSDYFIQKFFDYIQARISLKIIKCNINIQKRLNININNYKDFSEKFSPIELEIIPAQNKYGPFIKIKEVNKKYFHIYFNDNKEEIKKTELNKEDNVSKINIIIDYQIKSFERLFDNCKCIESINFKKFYRNNITNMCYMFISCSSLKELNLSNFNTNNVTNMCCMFHSCSSLKELNLSSFNTNNVTDMSGMFSLCSSLKELNLSNFNTSNVNHMICMFDQCLSLQKLNLSNFNTSNVTNMTNMFYLCSSLKELIINNFNTSKVTDMKCIFTGCPDELKLKILSQYKNFQDVIIIDEDY